MPDKGGGLADLGKQFGKPDIERLGLFIESPYLHGKKYVPFGKPPPGGGRNIMGEGSKTKSGTQHGYFDKEFKRIFEGEGISWKKPKKEHFKQKASPFYPTGPGKLHSSLGDYYGCFSGNIEAFGTGRKPEKYGKKVPKILPNMKIGATKMGNSGYADICLSRYPEHMPDPKYPKFKRTAQSRMGGRPFVPWSFPQPCFDRNPFAHPDGKVMGTYQRPKGERNLRRGIWVPSGPGKWEGGCKGGTFNPFPEHMACPYVTSFDANKPKKRKGDSHFYPQSYGDKTLWYFSINNLNTDVKVNQDNYKTYEANYIKHLVD